MSARSTISVFACGMSSPDSMMVVEQSTSWSPRRNSSMTCLELPVAHLPVRDADPHLGHEAAQLLGRLVDRLDAVVQEERLPATVVLAPIACATSSSSHSPTCVRIGLRSAGGVAITEMSRRPASDMCSVRGIGVADSESTSTSRRSARRSSFWATPKRCSSSTITSPSVFGHDVAREHAVGADQDVDLALGVVRQHALTSPALRMRETSSMRSGKSRKRSRKVCRCCCASTVVGASTSTWRPALATLNAARSATSVLPKPTSPQISRSIGRSDSRSSLTASIARA